MRFDDWLLALHVLSAFALVGALTIFSIGLVALRSANTPGKVLAVGSALRVANVAVAIGVAGTIVFGLWLAIKLDAYQVWDLWVILALVGWAAASAVGGRAGALIGPMFERAKQLAADGKDGPDPEFVSSPQLTQAGRLHLTSTLITVLVLVDMIWKPGA